MTAARQAGYRPGLVDLGTGLISREIFVNDEIYREEQERIFARAWLLPLGMKARFLTPATSLFAAWERNRLSSAAIAKKEKGPRLSGFLPPSRHEGVPVRRRQHTAFHMSLPCVELFDRWKTGRGSAFT